MNNGNIRLRRCFKAQNIYELGSVQIDDGIYACTIEFIVVGGNAKNIDGELIQRPLI